MDKGHEQTSHGGVGGECLLKLKNTQSHHLKIQIRNYNRIFFSITGFAKLKIFYNSLCRQECKERGILINTLLHSWLEMQTGTASLSSN